MNARELLEAARADLARGYTVRGGTRLRQAADAGSEEALGELVRLLLNRRIPGDAREARKRLEAAGDKLPPETRLLRAELRYAGVGGAAEPRLALDDLTVAAAVGLATAATELALIWREYGDAGLAPARAWLAVAAPDSPSARELLALLPPGETPQNGPPPVPDDWASADQNKGPSELLNAEPRIERFGQALDPLECAWLRATAQSRLAPSLVLDPRTGAPRADPTRTGETMCFGPYVPSVYARRIVARMALLAGRTAACAEPLAVLRYLPGQEYKPHYDWLGPAALARDPLRDAGERATTVLAYLNAPEAGGGTLFPHLDLRVAPIPGDVLTFANLDAAGRPATRSQHAGEPVAAGEKWLASLWIRARPISA
ncbi:MAG: prolyl hydroxylase family protein [Gammaproteobacteria bacterium]